MSHQVKSDEQDEATQESHRLAGLSHELKTPLAIISGYAEVLQEELGTRHEELIALIREASERLGQVVDALVSLEASDLQKVAKISHLTEFSPLDIVRTILSETYQRARAARVTFSLTLDGMHWSAYSCSESFKGALKPLIENAIKFAGPGLVEVAINTDEKAVSVRIMDSGPGLGSSADNLFEPFVQGSTGLNRQHEGLGLGLTLAHRSAERIHGSLEIETRPTGGTVAHLQVPRLLNSSSSLAA